MAKDIQSPPRIYDYVAELSCCTNLTQFYRGNDDDDDDEIGKYEFFHAHNQTNSFISSTDHEYGRIWNIHGSNARFHA